MGSVLIICRSESDLSLIDKAPEQEGATLIVASDSPKVQDAARRHSRVSQVLFMESMESVFSVANDILKIRKKVNSWLITKSWNIPPYLLEWTKWAEGDDTTQRIQDAVLLINSYKSLLSKNISEIILKRRIETYLEDEILLATAKSMGIISTEYKTFIFSFSKACNIVPIRKKLFGKEREIYIPKIFFNTLKRLLLLIRILRCKLESRGTWRNTDAKEVTFLLGSSADKHIDNTAFVMIEFKRRNNYLPIALCWNALSGCKKIRQRKLYAENLEYWFPTRKVFRLMRIHWNVRCYFYKCYHDFEARDFLKYKGVSLGPILLPFIKKFIQYDFASRLAHYFCASNYLYCNHPIAIRAWGENILLISRIFYELLKSNNHNLENRNIVTFTYPVGIMISTPYPNREHKPDLFFLSDQSDKDIYQDDTGNASNVKVTGFINDTKIKNFIKYYTVEKSKDILKIPYFNEYNFFYASTGILRGYNSPTEIILLTTSLIEFTFLHPNVNLIIKPHPSEPEKFWCDLLDKCGKLSNVYLIDKNQSPYHCINISNVVITKFSTLALEAVEFGKPVISVALDKEDRFQNIFKEGIEKFTEIESFISLMENIVSNKEKFEIWSKKRLLVQKEFLPQKIFKSELPVKNLIVDSVIEEIEKRMH